MNNTTNDTLVNPHRVPFILVRDLVAFDPGPQFDALCLVDEDGTMHEARTWDESSDASSFRARILLRDGRVFTSSQEDMQDFPSPGAYLVDPQQDPQ